MLNNQSRAQKGENPIIFQPRIKLRYQKKCSDGLISPTVLLKKVTNNDTSTKESKEDTKCYYGASIKEWRI